MLEFISDLIERELSSHVPAREDIFIFESKWRQVRTEKGCGLYYVKGI